MCFIFKRNCWLLLPSIYQDTFTYYLIFVSWFHVDSQSLWEMTPSYFEKKWHITGSRRRSNKRKRAVWQNRKKSQRTAQLWSFIFLLENNIWPFLCLEKDISCHSFPRLWWSTPWDNIEAYGKNATEAVWKGRCCLTAHALHPVVSREHATSSALQTSEAVFTCQMSLSHQRPL